MWPLKSERLLSKSSNHLCASKQASAQLCIQLTLSLAACGPVCWIAVTQSTWTGTKEATLRKQQTSNDNKCNQVKEQRERERERERANNQDERMLLFVQLLLPGHSPSSSSSFFFLLANQIDKLSLESRQASRHSLYKKSTFFAQAAVRDVGDSCDLFCRSRNASGRPTGCDWLLGSPVEHYGLTWTNNNSS